MNHSLNTLSTIRNISIDDYDALNQPTFQAQQDLLQLRSCAIELTRLEMLIVMELRTSAENCAVHFASLDFSSSTATENIAKFLCEVFRYNDFCLVLAFSRARPTPSICARPSVSAITIDYYKSLARGEWKL